MTDGGSFRGPVASRVAAEPAIAETGLPKRERRQASSHGRRVLLALAGVALSTAAVLLIGRVASHAELLGSLRAADARWLPLVAAGELLAFLGYVLAYREIARVDGGPRLPVRLAAGVVLSSLGAFAAAPAGGLAVQYWALSRAGSGRREAVARVIALNLLLWVVLGGAAWLAALALLLAGTAPVALTLPWLAIVPLFAVAGAWVSRGRRGERLSRPAGGRLHALSAAAVLALRYVRGLGSGPRRRAGLATAPAALYWGGHLLALWAALGAFGISLPVHALVAGYATGYLATALPLPAGGAGGVDASLTYALTLVGVPLAPALLGAVAFRVASFWLPLAAALAFLPFARRLRDALVRLADLACRCGTECAAAARRARRLRSPAPSPEEQSAFTGPSEGARTLRS
jgi:uncharacterized membrane protein YbhN (UPF0104 family)